MLGCALKRVIVKSLHKIWQYVAVNQIILFGIVCQVFKGKVQVCLVNFGTYMYICMKIIAIQY